MWAGSAQIDYQKTRENQRNYRRKNSILKFIGICRRHKLVGDMVGIYRQNIFVGIYRWFCRWGIQFVWKYATTWWRQTILPKELSRDSNWDSCTVTWHFHRRNRNGITDGSNPSVIPSEKTIICPPICQRSLPLFLLLLLSHPTSPPKLQPNTHPNSPLFSTRVLKFLISCTWSQYPFLVDFIFFFCK